MVVIARNWGRQTVILVFGSAGGGFFSFVASIVMARLFDANTIGQYSVILSVAGILTMLLTLRVETGVVPVQRSLEAWQLIYWGVKRSFLYSSVLALVLIALLLLNQESKWNENLKILFFAVVLSLPLAISTLLTQVPLRLGDFFTFGTRSPVLNLTFLIGQLSLGRLWPTLIALTLSDLVARSVSTLSLVRVTLQMKRELVDNLNRDDLNRKPNLGFLKYIFPASVLDALTVNLLPLAITYLYSYNEAGEYAIATRIFMVPASLLAASLGSVLMYRLSRLMVSEPLRVYLLYKRVLLLLFTLGMLTSVFVYVFATPILSYLIGDTWKSLEGVARAMSIYIGISIPWSTLCGLFGALQKWREYINVSILRLFVTLIAWILCAYLDFSFVNTLFVVTLGLGLAQVWGLFRLSKKVTS